MPRAFFSLYATTKKNFSNHITHTLETNAICFGFETLSQRKKEENETVVVIIVIIREKEN